jgi:hypothetical protein
MLKCLSRYVELPSRVGLAVAANAAMAAVLSAPSLANQVASMGLARNLQ